MKRNLIKGVLLVVVPLLVIVVVAFIYYHHGTPTYAGHIASLNKSGGPRAFGLTIDHPPPNFFDRNSQLMIGFGLCLASICWGVAKIIKEVRAR
jgi:hypothetical protein